MYIYMYFFFPFISFHLRLRVSKKLAKEVDLKEVQQNINLIKGPGRILYFKSITQDINLFKFSISSI